MIRAEYDRKGLCLTVQGHGGGEYGEDIVCAAASILTYTLASMIRDFLSDLERLGRRWVRKMEVSLREGDAVISCREVHGSRAVLELIFESVCEGFRLLQEQYPDRVKFICK